MSKIGALREKQSLIDNIDETIKSGLGDFQVFGYLVGMKLEDFADVPEPEYIHKGLGIVKGTHVMLNSPPKKGKTTFIASMIASMDNGDEFIGEQIDKLHTWFFIDEGEQTIKELWNRTGASSAIMIPLHQNRRENLQQTIDAIIASYHMVEEKPDLIVFDAARSWFRVADGNDYETVTKAMEQVNRLRDDLGVTVISLTHNTKGTVDTAHGSVAWEAQIDTRIGLAREDNRLLLTIDGRFVSDNRIAARWNELTREITPAELPQSEALATRRDDILNILRQGPMSKVQICEETGASSTTIVADLNYLLERERIERIREGRNINYRLVDVVEHLVVEGDA